MVRASDRWLPVHSNLSQEKEKFRFDLMFILMIG